MCAVQDAVTQSDGLGPEQSEMAVSVIAVCRHPDKLLRASEQLSLVVTAATYKQPLAEGVGVLVTTVPEAQQQSRQCQAQVAATQDSSERSPEVPTCRNGRGLGAAEFDASKPPCVALSTASAGSPDAAPIGTSITLTGTGAIIRSATNPNINNPSYALRQRSAASGAGAAAPAQTAPGGGSNIEEHQHEAKLTQPELTTPAPDHASPTASSSHSSSSASPSASSTSSSSSAVAAAASICTAATAAAAATKPDISVLASAVAASKLGLVDQLSQALNSCAAVAFAKDAEERTCLHYAAGYGHEECVSLLLERRSDTRVRDSNGDVPLHFAAIHGHPMCAYNITKACPSSSLTRNFRGQTPVEVAVACERGEVLNAMLLACAGDGSGGVTVQAMRKLLASGAVPDTWAPNGSSALMLAAAANGTEALGVLLEAGATLELQDALGRSALMFAAGNCAKDTLVALLDAGACISQRDRRGRNVLDYAPAGSEVRRLLQARLDELEAVANKRQADLLASLGLQDVAASGGSGNGMEVKTASGSGKKKKQQPGSKKSSTGAPTNGPSKVAAAAAAAGNGSGSGQQSNGAALGVGATGGPSKVKSAAQPTAATRGSLGLAARATASRDTVGAAAAGRTSKAEVGEAMITGAAAATAPPSPQPSAPLSGTAAQKQGRGLIAPSNGHQDHGGIVDGDDDANEWQTVSSYKCAARTRQQQQQHEQEAQPRVNLVGGSWSASAAGSATSSSLCPSGPGLGGPSTAAAAWAGGYARHGRGSGTGAAAAMAPSASASTTSFQARVGVTSAAATATGLGRSGAVAASGRSTPPQSSARGQPAAPLNGIAPSLGPTMAVTLSSQSKSTAAASSRGGSGSNSNTSGTGQLGPSARRAPHLPPLPAASNMQPLTTPEVAAAPPAAAAPPTASLCGFKAALLGLDGAAAATAVHLDLPPIAVSTATARPPISPQPSQVTVLTLTSGPGASSACTLTSADRKPAWGGIRQAVQPLTAAVVSVKPVAGCSPQSYPPLSAASAAAATGGGGGSSQAAQAPVPAIQHKASAQTGAAADAVFSPGPRQPLVPSVISAGPPSPVAPPPTPAAAAAAANTVAAAANPLAPASCADTVSAAAVSVPPSVASLAESEASSTGRSTCSSHNPGAGSSSPQSFGHDWTRPSPVDVLLQAAIAAGSGGGGAASSASLTGDGERPRHSKSSSAASISCLTFDITSAATATSPGLSPLDAVVGPPLAPTSSQPPPPQQQQPSATPCLGVNQLGGTEVPPPVRRSREGAALPLSEGILAAAAAGGTLPRATVLQAPSRTTSSPALIRAGDAVAGGPAAGERSGRAPCGVARCVAAAIATCHSCGKAAAGNGFTFPEVASLKSENEALHRRLRQAEQRHSQELAAVLFDAEEHQTVVVERAIAQERLRITANLLAIGLCPEAILAVVTPPGHGLNFQQLLAADLSLNVRPQLAQQPTAAATTAATTIDLPANLDVATPTPAKPLSTSSATVKAPSVLYSSPSANGSGVSLPSATSFATAVSTATLAASCRSSGSGMAISPAASAAVGGGGSGSGDPRPQHFSDSGCCLPSGGDAGQWEDGGSGCGCGGSSGAATNGGSADGAVGTAVGSDGGQQGFGAATTRPARLPIAASAAIAIPCGRGGGDGSLGLSSAATSAAAQPNSHSYRALELHGFGSPSGMGCGGVGIGSVGSFGSGGGVVGSLCAGLGLGLLPGAGEANGDGMAATVGAEAGLGTEGEEDCEMDLPACGDISALLAMSDDDV